MGLQRGVGGGGLGHRLLKSGETRGPWSWRLQRRGGSRAAPGWTEEPGAGAEAGVRTSRAGTSAGPLGAATRRYEAGDSVGLRLHTPNVSHYHPDRPAAPGQPQPSRAPAPPSPSQNSQQLPCLSAVLCAGPRGTHHGAPEPSWDGAHSEEGDWLMEGGCGDASRCLGLLICKVRVTSAPALRVAVGK